MSNPLPFDPIKVEKLIEHTKNGWIVGLGEVTGVLPRKEIDFFIQEDPETFNLLVQAFNVIQQDDFIDSPMGFFQLAGIHGYPRYPWNGAKLQEKENPYGYCEHSTLHFPTWHRPFLAALEQSLYIQMVDIAQKYTDEAVKKQYLVAVQKFRLPYWDYFWPRDYEAHFTGVLIHETETKFPYSFQLPQIFHLPKLRIRKVPDNNWNIVVNPFKEYKFPEPTDKPHVDLHGVGFLASYNASDYPNTKHTVRWSVKNEAEGSLDKLNNSLENARANNVDNIYHMLTNPFGIGSGYSSYKTFASNYWRPKPQPVGPKGSLESIHNNMHNVIAGINGFQGHMGDNLVSAFDPIFWMHHANIDRWLSVWQAINFDSSDPWVTKEEDKELLPFQHPDKVYWNSVATRDTEKLGYTYPNIEKDDPQKTIANFEKLEAWSRNDQNNPKRFPEAPPERLPLDLSGSWVYNDPSIGYKKPSPPIDKKVGKAPEPVFHALEQTVLADAPAVANPATIEEPAKVWQWFADVVVERMALDGSFGIYYFVGPPSTIQGLLPKDYHTAPTFAGQSYNLASPGEGCANCADHAENRSTISSTEVITPILIDYLKLGKLESLRPEHVKPFLIDNLRWRIVTVSRVLILPSISTNITQRTGVLIDPRSFSQNHELDISVSSALYSGPADHRSVQVEDHADVIAAIIAHSSRTQTSLSA